MLARFLPGDKVEQSLPPEILGRAIGILKDPAESWWVKDAALMLVARGTADMIAPHVDVLIPYLQHQEQWLQNGAALRSCRWWPTSDVTEGAAGLGELLRSCQRISTTGGPNGALPKRLTTASTTTGSSPPIPKC